MPGTQLTVGEPILSSGTESFGRAQTPLYSSPVSFAGPQGSQVVSDLFKRLETVSSWPLFLSVPLEKQVSGESSLLNCTSPKRLL